MHVCGFSVRVPRLPEGWGSELGCGIHGLGFSDSSSQVSSLRKRGFRLRESVWSLAIDRPERVGAQRCIRLRDSGLRLWSL